MVSKKFAAYVKVEVYNEERENNPMLKKTIYLFYLTFQYQITESCSYIIIISKKNEAVFEHMGVLNYYVSEENRI